MKLLHVSHLLFGCLLSLVGASARAEDPAFTLNQTFLQAEPSRIALYATPSRGKESRGVFLYSHGMTSRVSMHESLLRAVYEAGYDVVAYDLPGHGNSERYYGLKGGVRDFEQYVSVLHRVRQAAANIFKTDKMVFAGWSLGGLITTVFLQKYPEGAKGAVLYAPGIATALRHGDLSILIGVNPQHLVHSTQLAEQKQTDPSFFRFPPPCLMSAIYTGTTQAKAELYAADTLLFTAGDERFTSNRAVEKFYKDAQEAHHSKLTSLHMPQSRHDLENDVAGGEVIAATIRFLEELPL